MYKYVKVTTKDLGGGVVRPVDVHWEDGSVFHVTEVVRVIRNCQVDYHKYATCYEVAIGDYRTEIYRDRDGWFVDAKERYL